MHRIIPFLVVTGFALTIQPRFVLAEPFAEPTPCCTPLEKIQTQLSLYTLYQQQGDVLKARQALFDAQVLLQLNDPQLQQQSLWEQVASAQARLSQWPQAEAIYTRLYINLYTNSHTRSAREARLAYVMPLADLALAQQDKAKARRWLVLADQAYSATDFPARLAYALWAAGLSTQAAARFQFLFSERGHSLRQAQPSRQVDTWRLAYASLLLSEENPEAEALRQQDAWTLERLLWQAKAHPPWRAQNAVKQRLAAQDFSHPLSVEARLMRGQLALQLGDYAQARQDFEAVLTRWPGERLALQGLAMGLKGQQRYALAHARLTALQAWFLPEDTTQQDIQVRLAEIERAWQDPVQAVRRLQRLPDHAEASRLAESIAKEQWLSANEQDLNLDSGFFYRGAAGWQQHNLFIGERYVSLGVSSLTQRLGRVFHGSDPTQLPLLQELGLHLESDQPLQETTWFPFLRGKVFSTTVWRHEFAEGPLHVWVSPTLAYQWGMPFPLSIGANQHGRLQLESGLQLDAHQALMASGQLAVGEAELFLGSFYNYGGDLSWRWRAPLPAVQGLWGVDAVTGLDNYLVLDGNNQTQNLFRQRNAVSLLYQDTFFDYQGRLELAPIYGSLSDLYGGTQQRLDYRFTEDWTGMIRAEWHHYQQPVQRLQNRWQAGVGLRYALPMPQAFPLSFEIAVDWVHFYQSDQAPTPQLSLRWETRQ